MSNTITIRRRKVSCHIGVPDEERSQLQTLEISVTFPVPGFTEAAASDDVDQSVDYYPVYLALDSIARERPRKLIETLAKDIRQGLKDKFKLNWVDIEIRKFILPDAEAVVFSSRESRE